MPDYPREYKDVLVVDDDESILFAYQKLFAHVNLRVDLTSTIEEAKELVLKVSYRVVVTDMRFDGESHEGGYEVLTHVKRCSPETRVIMVTAYSSTESMQRAHDLGVDYYFGKPIQFSNLLKAIRSLGLLTQVKENRSKRAGGQKSKRNGYRR